MPAECKEENSKKESSGVCAAVVENTKEMDTNRESLEPKLASVAEEAKVNNAKQIPQPEEDKSKRPMWNISTMKKSTKLDKICSVPSASFPSTMMLDDYVALKKTPAVLSLAKQANITNKKRITEMNKRMSYITGQSKENQNNLTNVIIIDIMISNEFVIL